MTDSTQRFVASFHGSVYRGDHSADKTVLYDLDPTWTIGEIMRRISKYSSPAGR